MFCSTYFRAGFQCPGVVRPRAFHVSSAVLPEHPAHPALPWRAQAPTAPALRSEAVFSSQQCCFKSIKHIIANPSDFSPIQSVLNASEAQEGGHQLWIHMRKQKECFIPSSALPREKIASISYCTGSSSSITRAFGPKTDPNQTYELQSCKISV